MILYTNRSSQAIFCYRQKGYNYMHGYSIFKFD